MKKLIILIIAATSFIDAAKIKITNIAPYPITMTYRSDKGPDYKIRKKLLIMPKSTQTLNSGLYNIKLLTFKVPIKKLKELTSKKITDPKDFIKIGEQIKEMGNPDNWEEVGVINPEIDVLDTQSEVIFAGPMRILSRNEASKKLREFRMEIVSALIYASALVPGIGAVALVGIAPFNAMKDVAGLAFTFKPSLKKKVFK